MYKQLASTEFKSTINFAFRKSFSNSDRIFLKEKFIQLSQRLCTQHNSFRFYFGLVSR